METSLYSTGAPIARRPVQGVLDRARRFATALWPRPFRRVVPGSFVAASVLALFLVGCGGGSDAGAGAGATPAAAEVDGHVSAQSVNASSNASDRSATTAAVQNWTACASEGQTCSFSGQKLVRYGSGSTYVTQTFGGGTACTNSVFGDPTPGVFKACAYTDVASVAAFDPSSWTVCATEGGTCAFDGTRQVRYGTTTQSVTLQSTASVACTNAVFGDPAVGTLKTCWVANPAAASATTETWTPCAQENQFCAFTGTRTVRYGVGTALATGSYSNGVNCSNGVFGDPAQGIFKSCSFSSIDTSSAAGATVASVTLPPLTAAVLGTPIQLSATVNTQTGSSTTTPLGWTVADPTIATVNASGVATPLRAGFTTVTASVGGRSASGTLTVRGPTPIPVRSQYVGTNLGGLAYYGTNFPFSDMMKTSGGWGSNDGTPFASTAADGTPTALKPGQTARTPFVWTNTNYPAGRYTVLWDGDGTISFPMSSVTIDERSANRIVFEPNVLNRAMWVGIDATNPANPVRNVRLLMPGTEQTYATQPFNPDYLRKLAPFSVIRFMDWGMTNGSPITEWADRAQPSFVAYTSDRGVPIETMIELANSLHVDPWFCIPHKASDDYVRQFATLLHARLDPTLRPHIEYSNEVWNTGFAQNGWATQQANAQGLPRPWNMPSIYYAKRAVQIFTIMRSVYGATDSHRLVRVLAGQAVWTQFLQDVLGYVDTAANADVMAIAPYFYAESAGNPGNVDATLQLSSSQIVDQMLANVRGPVNSAMTSNAALAARYHLKLKAYESGPSDTTWSFPSDKQDAMFSLLAAANSNPRMKDLYVEYFGQWKAAGGDTMNQFVDIASWSKWGLWGALQSPWQDVSTSPKYQGLLAFIAANPVTTQQTTLGVLGGY